MGFRLIVVSPERIIYEKEDVDFIVLPAGLGQLGILKRHTPLLSSLKEGKIKIIRKNYTEEEIDVRDGFLEVLPDRVTVLISPLKTEASQDNEA